MCLLACHVSDRAALQCSRCFASDSSFAKSTSICTGVCWLDDLPHLKANRFSKMEHLHTDAANRKQLVYFWSCSCFHHSDHWFSQVFWVPRFLTLQVGWYPQPKTPGPTPWATRPGACDIPKHLHEIYGPRDKFISMAEAGGWDCLWHF